MTMASKRRLRRQADPLVQARREVRKQDPDELYAWMVRQSGRHQTIPIPYLIAACEHVGRRRGRTVDEVFTQLSAEVASTYGHGMPVENDKRGPLA